VIYIDLKMPVPPRKTRDGTGAKKAQCLMRRFCSGRPTFGRAAVCSLFERVRFQRCREKLSLFRLARCVRNHGARNAFATGQGLAVAAAILDVARQVVDGVRLRDARAW